MNSKMLFNIARLRLQNGVLNSRSRFTRPDVRLPLRTSIGNDSVQAPVLRHDHIGELRIPHSTPQRQI